MNFHSGPLQIKSAPKPPPNRNGRRSRCKTNPRRYCQTPIRPLPHSWTWCPKLNATAEAMTNKEQERRRPPDRWDSAKSEVAEGGEIRAYEHHFVAALVADEYQQKKNQHH